MALADATPYAVAHWALDETSGTRVDSVGSSDLTDNNTVSYATGMFGNAADFEASSTEYLSCTDNAALSMGDVDFCVRFWINAETLSSFPVVFRKGNNGVGNREYVLYYDTGAPNCLVWQVSNGSTQTSVNSSVSLSTATWYHVVVDHDATNNLIGITVNAGTRATASHSGGAQDGAGVFEIGAATEQSLYWDGLIDDFVILKGYILDSTERTSDYNSGTGVAFADWGGGATGHPALRRIGLVAGCRPVEVGREGAYIF